jgi:hypothetical protein
MKPITFTLILLASLAIIIVSFTSRQSVVMHASRQQAVRQVPTLQPVSLVLKTDVDSAKKRITVLPVDSTTAMDTIGDLNEKPYDPTADLTPAEITIMHIMDTTALAMFQRHDTVKVNSDMMSRCPSGYQYWVSDTNVTHTLRYGTIQHFAGCDGHEVCKFKIDVTTGLVLLKPRRAREYVSIQEYERKIWGKAS